MGRTQRQKKGEVAFCSLAEHEGVEKNE